ncbi:MAG: V-type ATP synthase subunit I [Rhodospirillales bacterium]|nr:MAG: V-type ATP synthase subunit I [Rhodospirillales bacterium]
MVRVTLCGLSGDKTAVLESLQALGVLHLIPLRTPGPLTPDDPAARRRADTAFHHLRDCREKLTPWPLGKAFDAEAVIAETMENRRTLRRLTDRRDELDQLIEALEPWGEFRLPEPALLRGERLWLYAVPVKDRAALDRLDLPWAVVGRSETALHVAVIAADPPPPGALPVPQVETGDATLAELRDERAHLGIAIEVAERARADLTRWRLALGATLAAAEDADDRRAAADQTLDIDRVFAVQGWAPADGALGLRQLAEAQNLALLVEPPRPDDQPPTLLRAEGKRKAMGSDLTSFYMSPGYRSWDPSIVVFASFAIFFAMILADAGYALLIGVATGFYWKRLGATGPGLRFRAFLASLTAAALIYGVAAGSYFGFRPPTGGWLERLVFLDVTDFEAMMRLSILIGAAHITIALAAVASLARFRGKGIAALGWIGVIAGGLAFWLAQGTTVGQFAPVLLIGGLGAVFYGGLTGQPPGATIGPRLGAAFLGLTGVTKLFGDLLSYLRLFALGLASASLAGTFNQLATDIHGSQPGIGLLLAILVFLFGHAINLAIGLMSGVVHGLRLNYIEFFGWGLPEEGYPFRAFAKREMTA